MTLVEFLQPIKNTSQRDLVLATLYYAKHQQGHDSLTVEQIRSALKQARIAKAKTMNIAAILADSGAQVDSSGKEGNRFLWSLTDTGEKHVRERLSIPEIDVEVQHDVASLRALASKVGDTTVRDYIEEAITCLSVNALRAAVVFLWAAAIRTLHERAMEKGEVAVNQAIQRQDSKARKIKKTDDFAYIKDRTFLDAASEIGILDKGEKDTLVEDLNLRNRCGHPTRAKPGTNKARGFIEDIITIVFT